MNAGATLARRVEAGSTAADAPLIIVDGAVREDLFVARMESEAPLGRRTAWLRRRGNGAEIAPGSEVRIVQPCLLAGPEAAGVVLFAGRVERRTTSRGGLEASDEWKCVCHWTRRLENAAEIEGVVTVREALVALRRVTGVVISDRLLDAEVLEMPVAVKQEMTAGELLEEIAESCGVTARQEMAGHMEAVETVIQLRPASGGARMALSLPQLANPAGLIASMRERVDAARPRRWTVTTVGETVESTFELHGAWSTADEGLAAEEYGKSTSSSFEAVANVYRRWVLNEDGAFSASLGLPMFDLTTFFESDDGITPQPLRFLDSLTRDESGQSVGIIVEVSTDDGASWFRHAGPLQIMKDRAGVYLDDDVLPVGYIGAALRVRVTASLRNPRRIACVRWEGNPFLPDVESIDLRGDDRFAVRRVASSSRFHDEIRSGVRRASEVDDRERMMAWLIRPARSGAPSRGGRVTIETAGVMPVLQPGDIIGGVRGVRELERIGGGRLRRVRHDWMKQQSELEWEAV